MPLLITESARRIASTKVLEFQHPNTGVWQDGVLVPGTTDDFRAVFTGVTPGIYGPGTLNFRLKGSYPVVGGTNNNTVTVYASSTAPAQPTVPTAPVIGSATAGDGTVRATWGVPASDGGSPITSFRIYRVGTAAAIGTAPATRSYFDDAGAANGTPAQYQVSGVNAVGEGPKSDPSAAVTPKAAATTTPTPTTYSSTQSYTTTAADFASKCGSGTTGTAVTKSSTKTSTVSQADADSLALADAKQQAIAGITCPVATANPSFNHSITPVGQTDGSYQATDSTITWTTTASTPVLLINFPLSTNTDPNPASLSILAPGGAQIGQLDYNGADNGAGFAVTYQGTTYYHDNSGALLKLANGATLAIAA